MVLMRSKTACATRFCREADTGLTKATEGVFALSRQSGTHSSHRRRRPSQRSASRPASRPRLVWVDGSRVARGRRRSGRRLAGRYRPAGAGRSDLVPPVGRFLGCARRSARCEAEFSSRTRMASGDSPILLLNEAANRIGAGEIVSAAVTKPGINSGGEAEDRRAKSWPWSGVRPR